MHLLALWVPMPRNIGESPRLHLPACIERVTIATDRLRIALNLTAIGMNEALDTSDEEPTLIEVPVSLRRCGMAVRLIAHAADGNSKQVPDVTLIALLAKAHV